MISALLVPRAMTDIASTSDTVWPQEELQADTVSLVKQATTEMKRLNLGHRTEQEP